MTIAPTGPHRVRRPFDVGDTRLAVGTVVDVTEWRNAFQLVDRGYLVAIPAAEVAPKPAVKKAPAKKAAAKKAAAKKPATKIED